MIVIDLTLRLRPGRREVEFGTEYTVARDGWTARTLHLYSHAGTYLDAPVHFDAGDQTIDEIPLADCMGRAGIASLESLAPRTPIMVEHLGETAARVQSGDALLLRTGWSRHVHDADYYRDNFPPISVELAEWIVAKNVRMVGFEPPSVADVNDLPAVTRIHKILLGAGVIIVEGLTGLDALTRPSCFLAAVPLKVPNGDDALADAFEILTNS